MGQMDAARGVLNRSAPADENFDIDETLLDATLKMSVRERLEQNDRMIRTVLELRAGFAACRRSDNGRTR